VLGTPGLVLGWVHRERRALPRLHFAMFLSRDLETTQPPARTDGRGTFQLPDFMGGRHLLPWVLLRL